MDTPLFHAVRRHLSRKPQSTHTPGHKNGTEVPQALADAWQRDIFRYDLTELPGLDNLADPQDALAESLKQAAASVSVHALRYLVNGSTLGLQAAILATCRNRHVFVPRHAHRSVYHALYLAGAEPISLDVTCAEPYGIPLGVAPATLARACVAHPQCRHMLLVHPTYHGFTWQNEALMQVARQHRLFTIADSAHGAHFFYHPDLPTDAYRLGCDLIVSGAHKTLPVLTQGALLLVREDGVLEDVDQALRMLQTTSPSYLLLLSLELGLAHMAAHSADRITEGMAHLAAADDRLAAFTHLKPLNEPTFGQDPFKWYCTGRRLHPPTLAERLYRAGIDVEMHDHSGVLLMLPLSGPSSRLIAELAACDEDLAAAAEQPAAASCYRPMPLPRVRSLKDAWFSEKETLPLHRAAGRVAADILDCYPPGIPLLLPGEIITQDLITAWQESGQSPEALVAVCLEKNTHSRYNKTTG